MAAATSTSTPTATATVTATPTVTATATVTVTPVPGGGGGGDPGDIGGGLPPVNATPELDSLALMGSGLLGLGGYALLRLRARRPLLLKRRRERLDTKDQDQQA